ncbi:MAG: DUF2911 domain-containing protein [Chryseolinea sp.]
MKRLTFLLFAVAMAITTFGQENKPLSPKATVEGKIGAAKVTIVYSQPSARGRKMLGEKEAFGKVWRTGANEATTIEFDKPVKLEGKDVPAGKYALFTIPNEKEWTIILNKEPNQMGAFNYQESKDLLRVNVPASKTAAFVETFNIAVGKDNIQLKWENTAVAFKVKG